MIVAATLLAAVLGLVAVLYGNRGDLPGHVEGPNPDNIPENQLPVCNFDGSKFLEEPCYSPPGKVYL